MTEHAPARSTMEDLQGVGTLFLRRQCSLGVLRIHFERAAIRLRLLDPDSVAVVVAYVRRMDEIGALPEREQHVAVSAMLDRFRRQSREPLPRLVVAPLPEPAFESDPMDAPVRLP